MADVSSIAQALAYCCAGLIYPQGLSGASITGRQAVVRRGWLLPSDLYTAQSVRNNVDYVTVTSRLSHYRPRPEPLGWPWREGSVLEPNVSVSVLNGRVSIVLAPDVVPVGIVGVRVVPTGGAPVVASWVIGRSDTAETIARGLASAFSGASADGGVLSVAGRVEARVAGFGRSTRITRRQTQGFTVSIWTSSAAARDVLGAALDERLASIGWFATVDGERALMTFEGAGDVDTMQMQALYRRDLIHAVTFDTVQTRIASQMLFGGGTIAFGPDHEPWREVSFGERPGQGGQDAQAAISDVAALFPKDAAYAGFAMDAFGTVVAAS